MPNEAHERVQEALYDIQRYLFDQIAPLNASEAMETLIAQPPELIMQQIQAWAVEQGRIQGATLADCLFHALRKIFQFGALRLVEPRIVDAYLDRLAPLALQACPAEERENLAIHVKSMREMRTLSTSSIGTVESIAKQQAPAAASAQPADNLVARSAHRLSLVIDRLASFLPGKVAPAPASPPAGGAPVEEPSAPLVTMAAASSSSEQELEAYLEKLRPYTGGAKADNVFHILGSSVPGWEIVTPGDTKPAPAAPVKAMHKIMTMTRSSADSTRRFRELLMSAIEQFNSGNLGAAVSMFELAELVIAEKKLDPSSVDRIRSDVVDSIKPEQLKKYAETKSKHVPLRSALSFFPTLTKESLLEQLRGEQRPERRRSILGLLEAYGVAGRDAALVDLETELNRPPEQVDTYYLRNVIYLLHRIPRDPDAPVEKELELLTRSSARGQSIYVIKEAIQPLGQIKNEAAVRLLTTRLAEFEALLSRGDTTAYPADEMQKLLDRIIAALGRIATPAALLTVARHGMKPNPLLGDTRSRLAVLSQHDLSFDEQTVNVLMKAIRDDLPKKVLGRVIPQRQLAPMRVIEALSSTRSEAVESLLAEIVEKYPDHEVGRVAATALATRSAARQGTTETTGATLTGDLQFFGLPSLMQSLAETQATGIVTLTSKESGQTAGKVLFFCGKFLDAQTGHLRGMDALYQLLERPVVGAFSFVPHRGPQPTLTKQPTDVMGLIFEGIRRHDELKVAAVVAPDDIALKATGTKPVPLADEEDAALVRDVWVRASGGTRVREWEPTVAADSYRIRRLVAHWVEQGALAPSV